MHFWWLVSETYHLPEERVWAEFPNASMVQKLTLPSRKPRGRQVSFWREWMPSDYRNGQKPQENPLVYTTGMHESILRPVLGIGKLSTCTGPVYGLGGVSRQTYTCWPNAISGSPGNVKAFVIMMIFFIKLKIQQTITPFKCSTKHSQAFPCRVDYIHSFPRHVASLDITPTNRCSTEEEVREKVFVERTKELNVFSPLELLLGL